MCFIFYYFISIFSCIKGITLAFYGISPHSVINIADAQGTNTLLDIYFRGSFCPSKNGYFRLIFDGSLNSNCENLYSSYAFYNYSGKSRITPYFLLSKSSCYAYYSYISTCGPNAWGKIFFQEYNQNQELITYNNSYSCSKNFCKDSNLTFPNCYLYTTTTNNFKNRMILNFIFLIL